MACGARRTMVRARRTSRVLAHSSWGPADVVCLFRSAVTWCRFVEHSSCPCHVLATFGGGSDRLCVDRCGGLFVRETLLDIEIDGPCLRCSAGAGSLRVFR